MRQAVAAVSPNPIVDISGASQQSLYSDSQPSGYTEGPDVYTTEEDFQWVMNTPPPNFRLDVRSFSAPAPTHIDLISNMEEAPPLEAPPLGAKKKRAAAQKPAAKKSRKERATEGQVSDDEGEGSALRWADTEVIQLISFRQEMDEEFNRNSKKLGVNTWGKLQAKMVVACDNFQKSPDACQKKWKYVYWQYAGDKRILQVSGEGRKVTCKFFDDIDQGFNNWANVRKMTHGDSRGTPNPCPRDLNGSPQEGETSVEAASTLGKENKTPYKRSNGDIDTGLFSDMASAILKISGDIHESTEVFKGQRMDLKLLIDKL